MTALTLFVAYIVVGLLCGYVDWYLDDKPSKQLHVYLLLGVEIWPIFILRLILNPERPRNKEKS